MSKMMATEEFITKVSNIHPDFEVLSDYVGGRKNVLRKCKVCGDIREVQARMLLDKDGHGCPRCAGKARISESDFLYRLFKLNSRVEHVSGYKNISSHAVFRCKECGNEWETLAAAILAGRGCPKCNLPHGALKIEKYLEVNNIDYIREYRFDDCKNNRPLPFDFYLPKHNACVEYDGEQHFKPVRFGYGETWKQVERKFVSQQKNDCIKTNYCFANGIKLVRIPYTDFDNIESILDKHFS